MVKRLKAGMSVYVSIDTHHTRSLAGLLGFVSDIHSLTLERSQGLRLTEAFAETVVVDVVLEELGLLGDGEVDQRLHRLIGAIEELLQRGVIVRPMQGYNLPQHIRVTLGRPEEMQAFWKAWDEMPRIQ